MAKSLLIAFGTRPEVIKCAPIIKAFSKSKNWDVTTLHTGQHTDLTEDIIEFFGIRVDHNLAIMEPGLSLDRLHSKLMKRTADILDYCQPDFIMAQGDTLSVLSLAQSSYYRQIPFLHIEAGLRTYDALQPYPEELNRQMVSRIAAVNFCATEKDALNLKNEKINSSQIHVVGNTVIDALFNTVEKVKHRQASLFKGHRFRILATIHRRENHGQPLLGILEAIKKLSDDFSETAEFVIPYHPNPAVKDKVLDYFAKSPNINVVAPLSYPDMVKCMYDASFMMSDSGGMQEEAPALGTPILVLRNTTEREATLTAGVSKIVGTDTDAIYSEAKRLMTDSVAFKQMSKVALPYGQGDASSRILAVMNSTIADNE